MRARVVTNEIQAGKIDGWLDLIGDSIVPALSEQAGFRGFVAMVDRENSKTIGHSMWEDEAALAASEASGK